MDRKLILDSNVLSAILNQTAEEASPRSIAKDLKLPAQVVEEVVDWISRNQDKETWLRVLIDRALSAFWPDCERGKTTPAMKMVAFRDATGSVDRAMYRHNMDDLEMLVGRHLDTPTERAAAEREVEGLLGLVAA